MPTVGFDDPDDIKPFDRKSRPGTVPKYPIGELGYEDPVLKSGRWRLGYYKVREDDPEFYTPKIKDGIIAPKGIEHGRNTEVISRELPGRISHEEWRDRRYFLDPNVKAIYEKHPIAKQHPGLMFRMAGTENFPELKMYAGQIFPNNGFLKEWPGVLPQSWKFFGAPFGEECHVKTAVCAKYGLIIGTGYYAYYAPTMYMAQGWKFLLKKWFFFNSFTVPAAAAWGAASCLAGSLRQKDDYKNMLFGALGFGSAIGMHKGWFYGYYWTIASSIAGLWWYYWIAHEKGFMVQHARMKEYNMGADPASYKWLNFDSKNWNHPKNF